jgi:MoaA/NifB/PqqE/SkfB family radical SAM enzyme
MLQETGCRSGRPVTFEGFTDAHAATLRAVFDAPQWREVASGPEIEEARRDLIAPPETENAYELPVAQLLAINEAAVREMIAAGERGEERLLAALAKWPEQWPEGVPVRLSFLGINLGFRCDMKPRCIYCNQEPVEQRMTAEDWAAVIRGAAGGDGPGPYVSFTGGEPLLLGRGLWGPQGLIRMAAEVGAACNVNTNALGLTPRVALGLVSCGLRRIHISLDTHRPEIADAIHRCEGRWAQVVRGLHNLQIAKALLGSANPEIHINCVLTTMSAADFPDFLRFLFDMKPVIEGISTDLNMHVIPVGGEQNARLRLSADEYVRFFTEVWAEANAVWAEYQEARGVPEADRGPLEAKVPYMSPYHRVAQRGGLEEWAVRAAEGRPCDLALGERCYVAPTQAFVLPDGSQYWCGGHTVARPEAVGNVLEHDVRENIRGGVAEMAAMPGAACRSCAGATMAINQGVEAQLRATIKKWLEPVSTTEAAP